MKAHLNIQDYLSHLQVVLVVGGLGSRLRHRTGDNLPKPLLKIRKKPLLDYCMEMFSSNGLTDFIFLVGYMGEKIRQYAGDGERYGVRIKYSFETEMLGKAGAIKFALENGVIDRTRPCVISYPDDLVLINNFPQKLIRRHLLGLERGCLATVVRVSKTQYRYGVVQTDDEGIVVDFQEKPFVSLPANVAIYVLEPFVYDIIEKTVDLDNPPIDFETVLVPKLVRDRLMFSFTIPLESWIPVNEEKEFMRAEEYFKSTRWKRASSE